MAFYGTVPPFLDPGIAIDHSHPGRLGETSVSRSSDVALFTDEGLSIVAEHQEVSARRTKGISGMMKLVLYCCAAHIKTNP